MHRYSTVHLFCLNNYLYSNSMASYTQLIFEQHIDEEDTDHICYSGGGNLFI